MRNKILFTILIIFSLSASLAFAEDEGDSEGVAWVFDPFAPMEWDPSQFYENPYGLAHQYLMARDFGGFLMAIYYGVMGEAFLGICVLIPAFVIYMRYDSIIPPSLFLMMTGIILLPLLPIAAYRFHLLFLGLGVAGILYKLFGERK